MLLEEKVRAVEAVFAKLDAEIQQFQQWSSLHCNAGCGKCCFKADIEASVLEFLPFAYHLFLRDEAVAWYENLKKCTSP
ncbi:MAG TPA: YkgJ family cysteine cluster protein, partial [Ohtaekwangia sp.]|nr:YkgJ family cysteine cluster protein [Ohtaekwangia sp.]